MPHVHYHKSNIQAADSAGNLYGTTQEGGLYDFGVVFKLDPGGTLTLLHSFTGGTDGAGPITGVTLDGRGNVFGVTTHGGDPNVGCGVVFKITP